MTEAEFNLCPIGRRNEQEIAHLEDRFSMAIERLEEKMDDIKTSIKSINNRLDSLEQKIDNINEELPSKIDKQIENNQHIRVYALWKWLITVLCSSLAITIVTKLVLSYINL